MTMTSRVGNHQKVVANGASVTGNHNTIEGNGNSVTGNHNRITGNGNSVNGNHNTVEGNYNHCDGDHNRTTGIGNTTKGSYNSENGVQTNVSSANKVINNGPHQGVIIGRRGIDFQGAVIGSVGSYNSVVMSDDGIFVDGVRQVFNNYPGSVIGTVVTGGGGMAVPATSKKAKPAPAEETLYVEVPTEAEAKTHDREASDDEAAACCICTANVLVCAVFPCRHRCLCCACARELGADGTKERGQVVCPLCQSVVKKIKVVY
jgi:hypothetical protein